MKPIYITSYIGTELNNVIGKNVLRKNKVVGKVIEYDTKTGVAKYEITDKEVWEEIAGDKIGIISSRKKKE
jgi:phenylalanine-4-hydroxylase